MKATILGNDIKWYVENESVTELDDATEAHIMECINEGYSSGQIVMTLENEEETTGWWEIIDWEDIALELYNALVNGSNDVEKAVKRFNENWE